MVQNIDSKIICKVILLTKNLTIINKNKFKVNNLFFVVFLKVIKLFLEHDIFSKTSFHLMVLGRRG
jgi:hypothetical protein